MTWSPDTSARQAFEYLITPRDQGTQAFVNALKAMISDNKRGGMLGVDTSPASVGEVRNPVRKEVTDAARDSADMRSAAEAMTRQAKLESERNGPPRRYREPDTGYGYQGNETSVDRTIQGVAPQLLERGLDLEDPGVAAQVKYIVEQEPSKLSPASVELQDKVMRAVDMARARARMLGQIDRRESEEKAEQERIMQEVRREAGRNTSGAELRARYEEKRRRAAARRVIDEFTGSYDRERKRRLRELEEKQARDRQQGWR